MAGLDARSIRVLAVLAVWAAGCEGDGLDPEAECGTIQAATPGWEERSVTIPPRSSSQVSFHLVPIGPAPVCARRVPVAFVCGSAGPDVVPPPGQPTAPCVPVPECVPGGPTACGPYALTVETSTPGTYELWLATSRDGIEVGPPQSGPLEVVVR